MAKYLDRAVSQVIDSIENGEYGYTPNNISGLSFVYDITNEKYIYPNSNELVEKNEERNFSLVMKEDLDANQEMVDEFISCGKQVLGDFVQSKSCRLFPKNRRGLYQYYFVSFSKYETILMISIYNDTHMVVNQVNDKLRLDYDEVTGLYTYKSFAERINSLKNLKKRIYGSILYFDILQFKPFVEMYGVLNGEKFLRFIADRICRYLGSSGFACHPYQDYFTIYVEEQGEEVIRLIESLCADISDYDDEFELLCNFGIYEFKEITKAEDMIDYAVSAYNVIKGNFSVRYNFFTKELLDNLVLEQQLVSIMTQSLQNDQFKVYFQPQYNHTNGSLIGAEALVRWIHPERGLISPGIFIPIFEKNGFVTNLDLYVFEQTCKFIKKCLKENLMVVPISTNVSRNDIYQTDFAYKLEKIRAKYDVPVKYLRIEITETAIRGDIKQINDFVRKLHNFGFLVEMDDFGSGYSSLNVLKDIDLDIIKLDMRFLQEETETNRGGTIISSIVRMAKWLSLPIIAEGVEELKQADFLKSIGCDYIQGYLYSKPIPENEFREILANQLSIGDTTPKMKIIETLDALNFWNPKSQETLIFSNYVGGAAIIDYHNGHVEMLRVNKKYLKELGMNQTEGECLSNTVHGEFDTDNAKIYLSTLDKALKSNEEEECETWRTVKSDCCGEERLCIRSNIKLIGKSEDSYLFYVTIRNITNERNESSRLNVLEKRFMTTAEQVNIYFWEYTVATHEMRPCFRCMRDLGLPAVVRNYPEPAIEAGIFPPDYADMMRQLLRDIDAGKVRDFEAVIPLTVGRVPFIVRYTVEFDSLDRPVKAFGSATLVVENK